MTKRLSHFRRAILVRGGLGVAAGLAAWLLPWPYRSAARAQETLPHLPEDDPMAQALMYVEDAAASTSPNRQEGAFCHNCRYYQGEEGAEWGPCQIFPENTVSRQGWCNVWVAREQ